MSFLEGETRVGGWAVHAQSPAVSLGDAEQPDAERARRLLRHRVVHRHLPSCCGRALRHAAILSGTPDTSGHGESVAQ